MTGLDLSSETQSLQLDSANQLLFKTPYKTYFQETLLPLQKNDVQAMLLQSESVGNAFSSQPETQI